jgi:APA family basic amino acid/polyamine antiporter
MLVTVADVRGAIGFSSFCVLTYYAIANACAWTLPPEQRRSPRVLAAAGIVGCATLAFTLPVATVVAGSVVLAVGALTWAVRHRRPLARGRSVDLSSSG